MTLTIDIIIAVIERIFNKGIKSKIELKLYEILLFTDEFDFDL